MAVQMFYPDHYNGAFVACPDPVDFRSYITANLYSDKNAFTMQGAHADIPQPAMRDYLGRTLITMQGVNQYELALGAHGRSGEQFDIWQAVYGPVGSDGYPQPIFDKETGVIDPDGRRLLERTLRSQRDPAARLADSRPQAARQAQYLCRYRRHLFPNRRRLLPRRFPEDHEESALRRRSKIRRPRRTLLERRPESSQLSIAPALPHHVPPENSRAHGKDRPPGSGSEVVALLV